MSFSFLSGAVKTTNTNFSVTGYILPSELEKALGNPSANGQILASNTDGVRYWTSNVNFDVIGANTIAIGKLVANGSTGLSGYVLVTDGTNAYWANSGGSVGFTGSRGVIGFTGSQGAQGVQGNIGFTGSQGTQGVQGATGFTGSQGAQGVQGAAGVQGATGAQGATGIPGTQGGTGGVGPQGPQGAQGVQGAQGSLGFTGSQGLQGAQGVQGAQGSIGFTGSLGFTGSQGLQGTQGVQGATGFVGSQGLQGVQGAQGTQGVQGATGFNGSRGFTGSRGSEGFTGSRGLTGFTGSQGLQGAQGAQGVFGFTGSQGAGFVGSQGIQGVQGVQGDIGFTGSRGAQGVQGTVGAQGVQGAVGAQGLLGTQGPTGFTGSQGVQGAQGTVGAQGMQGAVGVQGAQGVPGPIAGSTTQVIFNDGGVANGSPNFTFNKANNTISRGVFTINGSLHQANTAPANPQPGDQWFNTYNGILFVYLKDGDSEQWVDIGSLPGTGIQGPIGFTGSTGAGFVGSQGSQGGLVGKQTIFVAASAMLPLFANGAALGTFQTANNRIIVSTLDFDATSREFAQFQIAMPKSWNEGSVTFDANWFHGNTSTNFGVVWSLAGVALSDGNILDTAFGNTATVVDTGGTMNVLYDTPESANCTIGNTPDENDFVVFQIAREPADANDTMAIDARLLGIRLFYTVNAGDDT
jgi:collagen type I alpha